MHRQHLVRLVARNNPWQQFITQQVAEVMCQFRAEGFQICDVGDDVIVGFDSVPNFLRFDVLWETVGHGFSEIDFGIDLQKGSGDWIMEVIQTFYFCTGVEVSEPKAEDTLLYDSLSDAIAKLKFTIDTPTYIPEGFILSDVIVDRSPKQVTILAIYKNENNYLKISVQSFLEGYPEQVEMSGDFSETYIVDGTDYYLFSNHNQAQAVWIINTYECYISGELSIDEIKLMIDSIGKG